MSGPDTAEAFGTITPFGSGSFKVGLLADSNNSLIVKAGETIPISKWTVQNFDNSTPNVYRLFVGDGSKDYGLRVPQGASSIFGLSGSPSSSDSHVWHISRSPDGLYYYIQELDPRKRAWKRNNEAIELAVLPTGDDEVNPFKFKFSF